MRGLQVEILVSLLVVMLTAVGLLGVVLMKTHEADARRFHELMTRALVADARNPAPGLLPRPLGIRWWTAEEGQPLRPRGPLGAAADPETEALAAEVRRLGVPLLRTGPPWTGARFASPTGAPGEVAVAWLPPTVPGGLIVGLIVADVAIFSLFGAYLLRRRLVLPLLRLAEAARSHAAGEMQVRAPVDGVRETMEVAQAFNDMTESLEGRSRELENAVADLSERNRSLQEARAGLDRAERLAAVGRLAAGVAHEVGNPMGALLAFVDLARRDPGLKAESHGYLEKALRQGERVRAILCQLLDYARPQRATPEAVDLHALCLETASLVTAQRRYAKIAVQVQHEGVPPAAWVDPGGAAQIVLNLLLNAADAVCTEVPEPRIRVTVGAVPRRRAGEGDRERVAVVCTVEDNGPGIAPEDRERIFDPFFSTKPQGEGTGLGLSNAQRLAEEFHGSLTLAATGNLCGAAFALQLPAASKEVKESWHA